MGQTAWHSRLRNSIGANVAQHLQLILEHVDVVQVVAVICSLAADEHVVM